MIAILLILASATTATSTATARRTLVVCSPGSPGTTAEAQPTMDAFAQTAGRAAGWPAGSLRAVYFESAEGGVPRLSEPDAALAMVSLPFLLRYGRELGLRARLETVPESGETEVWSLVAKKGRISSPASLAGWEVTGAPGYAEEFVRGTLLGAWGALPADLKITFTARALAALRRAAIGEKVAVLLDRAQATALPSLPFAAELQVVRRSGSLPSGFLCTVGDRLPPAETGSLFEALLHLHEKEAGRNVLKSLRMVRFTPVDQPALEAIRASVHSRPEAAK